MLETVNPYLERIVAIAEQMRQNPTPGNTMPESKQGSTLVESGLGNVDCPICGNTGNVLKRVDENGIPWYGPCKCLKRRNSIKNLDDSGLRELVQMYRFDNFQTDNEKYKAIKKKALEFARTDAEGFIIMGRPGSGKTHICTAICSDLMERNYRVRYFIWNKLVAELKALVNSGEEYTAKVNMLKNVPVLYIDDFLKGEYTPADVKQAFMILNDRYNSRGKKTIISTERNMTELINFDEAVGSRLAERARGYTILAPNENWRIK